jgi:hypothetical protein
VHDGVRAEVVKAMGSERTLGASRCDIGRQPECSRRWQSADEGGHKEMLQGKMPRWSQEMRKNEGKRLV